jgi:hypothetical protein
LKFVIFLHPPKPNVLPTFYFIVRADTVRQATGTPMPVYAAIRPLQYVGLMCCDAAFLGKAFLCEGDWQLIE